MAIEIVIPRLGWSMEEGNFVAWLKKDGDSVRAGEPLFSLEGEKATQDIESIDEGVLQIPKNAPKQGEVVKVGQVIGYLTPQGEDSKQVSGNFEKDEKERSVQADSKPTLPAKQAASISTHSTPATKPEPAREHQAISPRARRRAKELNVEITLPRGSGTSGRITEADVIKLAAASSPAISAASSTMRRAIAERTVSSFSSIPHFYLGCEADVTALLRLREDLLPEIEGSHGVRLTVTDFLLRAQALALRANPHANAIWQNNSVVRLSSCDIGLLVGLPDGLLLAILRAADHGTLADVARQRTNLVEQARGGSLAYEAMQGGATSLSNLGATRVDEFSAVIAAPQSSMLAVGRAALRPYAFQERLALRRTMKLRLSVDHRVLDGGPAAEYLGAIVDLLENPDRLLSPK